MVLAKYMLISFLMLTNAALDLQAIDVEKGGNRTCNKQAIEEILKNNTKLVDVASIREECLSIYQKCFRIPFSIDAVYANRRVTRQTHLLVTLQNVKTGCWGYLVNIYINDAELYLSKYKLQEEIMGRYLIADHKLVYDVPYVINVTQIPSGQTQTLIIQKTPSKCEIAAVTFSRTNAEKAFSNCLKPPGFSEIKNSMSKVCKHFSNDIIKVTRYLNQSKLTQNHCRLVPFNFSAEGKLTKKSQIKTHIIVVSIGGLLIILILVVFNIVRKIKQNFIGSHKWSRESRKKDFGFKEEEKHDTITRVMILNRPGCELLDTLMRDLALVLKAYGIDVKLSLLEQSQIDAEGGISSYIQRNIDSCDYVLILFTEHNKEHTSSKHRPYEFALKLITAMAYHQNSSFQFIPLYLTSYDKAITLIPSFLLATQDAGYRIPKNIMSLVTRLSGGKKPIKSKEMLPKLNFFLNRMRATCKKVESKKHKECSEGDCDKGALYDSVSNLSSVFASTAPSKWPSFHSIANYAEDGVFLQHEVFSKSNLEPIPV
ncbi:uncharacterized protein LOC130638053 isoform X1 [Hydractinia symbiolongicarpus]|uniref:uncharacterized protein LOC130638053 isoform X1 n=2 Tax=Hydractinia symbiolongicarpus TaxID=13093 RepID=UPI00254AAE60|nr:uncharacterized protein LOC130638053 isoform X1 [Hydractinia symbiolongicarpus]